MSADKGECVPEVDTILKSLREQAIASKPNDVVGFLQTALTTISKEGKFRVEDVHHLRAPEELFHRQLTVVVLGASGDLAKKKTFPALFQLFCSGLLPHNVNIIGYARSKMDDVEKWKRETLSSYFSRTSQRKNLLESFLKQISYVSGSYDKDEDFRRLAEAIAVGESKTAAKQPGGNRLFYLALPPTAFVAACTGVRHEAVQQEEKGWTRVIVEKPFGHDTASSAALSNALEPLFTESQLFRIDHYLGKEMVQNILTTRFANRVFSSLWNHDNIACVQITFKEKIGTEGRGGYFDNFGIIRDVIQNHLTQILALIAMEKPRSLSAEDIRDAKVALLKCVKPVEVEDCVLGQYTASADGKLPGYLEDPTVPKNSKCPTFATLKVKIDNDRWDGVPFIIKAGKALEQKYVGIRVQFKDEVRPYGDLAQRNELVFRAQPSEAMYLKLTAKEPGLTQNTHQTELDLTYHERYDVELPEAYESLIYEAVAGNSANFVRKDELDAAWKIFTPLLHQIDAGKIQPLPYQGGTRGPQQADDFLVQSGFKHAKGYTWSQRPHL